ncbi:OmpA/MotB family protein [Candidatus Nitrospira bockiana]
MRVWALIIGFALIDGMVVHAEAPSHLSVRLGEQALAFSSGFIRESVPVHGVVTKTPYSRMIVGQTDTVYARMEDPSEVAPGSLYTVYRRIHPVFHPVTHRAMGDLFSVLAVIRIVKIDDQLATAKIERGYSAVHPGDRLMPFVPPPPPDSSAEADQLQAEGYGRIIDVQTPRTLIAQNHFVYIDWGREDGLRIGDRLDVLRSQPGYPNETIATIKVVALEETTASALVLRALRPVGVGDQLTPAVPSGQAAVASPVALPVAPAPPARSASRSREELSKSLATEIAKGDVSITQSGDRVTISLNDLVDQLEYDPGDAHIKPTGLKILKQISDYLKQQNDQEILVEGHTDNMRIGRSLLARYPSNRELSEARANLIVRYFIEAGLDPGSLSAIGHAETRPVASNATEEGRRKNRRIEIVLNPKPAIPPQAEAPDLAPLQVNVPGPASDDSGPSHVAPEEKQPEEHGEGPQHEAAAGGAEVPVTNN